MTPSSDVATLEDHALEGTLLLYSLGSALNLALGQAVLPVLCVLLLLRFFRRDPALLGALTRFGPPAAAATVFLLACVASNLMTPAPFPGFFDATRWRPLFGVVVGGLGLATLTTRTSWRCALVFAAGCAVHGLLGFYQARTGASPLADLLHIPAERRTWPAPDNPSLFSAVGLFYNRVRLSHVLAAGCGMSAAMALLQPRWRAVWMACAASSLLGLMFTYGRAALGALLVTLVVLALVQLRGLSTVARRRVVWATGGLLAVVVVTVVAVPSVHARMATAVDVSRNQDRLFLWGRGAEMAQDHAPYGTGFGGYSVVRDPYYNRRDPSVQSRAMSHNLLLTLLAETGVLGLMAWLWMWWELFKSMLRTRNAVAWAGGVGAFTFHAATLAHDPLYQSECALAWGFCGALMAAGCAREVEPVQGVQ